MTPDPIREALAEAPAGHEHRRAQGVSIGMKLIDRERYRQISEERYDADWDRQMNNDYTLALAAACYATPAPMRRGQQGFPPTAWPWAPEAWKPTPDDRLRELVKAGALIAAAIDLLSEQRGEPAL